MATHSTTRLRTADEMAASFLTQSSLKGIDLAEELHKAALAAAPPTTTTTLPHHIDPKMPVDTVVVSPRVQEELSQGEIVQAVQEVLGFSFPKPSGPEVSIFSGYIFVNGKQVAWARYLCNRMGGSRISLTLREEKETLSSCLDAKTLFAMQ